MDLLAQLSEGRTLAEIQGIPAEMGQAIADIADGELEAGRTACALAILEGLVVTNPRDARAWALLARVHRRLGQHLAARLCAEVELLEGGDVAGSVFRDVVPATPPDELYACTGFVAELALAAPSAELRPVGRIRNVRQNDRLFIWQVEP